MTSRPCRSFRVDLAQQIAPMPARNLPLKLPSPLCRIDLAVSTHSPHRRQLVDVLIHSLLSPLTPLPTDLFCMVHIWNKVGIPWEYGDHHLRTEFEVGSIYQCHCQVRIDIINSVSLLVSELNMYILPCLSWILNPKVFDKPEARKKADLPISIASDATLVDPSLLESSSSKISHLRARCSTVSDRCNCSMSYLKDMNNSYNTPIWIMTRHYS